MRRIESRLTSKDSRHRQQCLDEHFTDCCGAGMSGENGLQRVGLVNYSVASFDDLLS